MKGAFYRGWWGIYRVIWGLGFAKVRGEICWSLYPVILADYQVARFLP